jgi:hypothetical protein
MNACARLLTRTSAAVTIVVLCAIESFAAPRPHYLITNNDASFSTSLSGNSATFYTIMNNGTLKEVAVVNTGGTGIDGIGSTATRRVSVLSNATQNCAFISDAGSNDVAGISIGTLTATGTFPASSTDSASSGLGIANNGSYLYANFTGSKTIATYQISSGCTLTFIGDTAAGGLQSFGSIIDMAAHGNVLVATFTDGSIESFNISGGTPVANGDLQPSTSHTQNGSGPNDLDITADGHFAIFGDGGSQGAVEVSDLSSGKLQPTIVYPNVGPADAYSAVWLSPDETLLYISNFSDRVITAAHFDKAAGVVSVGCSAPLRGNNFEAGLVTAENSGTGGTLYVAEPEVQIAIVNVSSSGGACAMQETSKSPANDFHSQTLESIGTFPPRPF